MQLSTFVVVDQNVSFIGSAKEGKEKHKNAITRIAFFIQIVATAELINSVSSLFFYREFRLSLLIDVREKIDAHSNKLSNAKKQSKLIETDHNRRVNVRKYSQRIILSFICS